MKKGSGIALSILLAAVGGLSHQASAAPITFDEYNVTSSTSVSVQLGSLGGDLLINVDGFGINVQAGTGVSNGDKAGVIIDGTATVQPQGTSLPIVKALTVGTVVGSSSTFYSLTGLQNALIDNTARNGEFPATPNQLRYFGFDITPSGSSVTDYGYVTIRVVNDGTTTNDPNGPSPYAAQVTSVTYDPTGAPLTITAIPEPATAGLMIAAGSMLLTRRRRRI